MKKNYFCPAILFIQNKRKNEETKYQSNDIQRNNRRNNQLSLDLISKNNNNNNKYLINEELSHNKANNIQIKTTRVVKIKNTQNENKSETLAPQDYQ